MERSQWSLDYLCSCQFLGAGYNLLKPEQLRKIAQQWEQQQHAQEPLWQDRIRQKLKQRKIRVGYLSADWRYHPVSRFMLPLLKAHNREQIEIYGLNATPTSDIITQEVQQSCDHWVELPRHNNHVAARVIAEQRIDIIVELGGFTSGCVLAPLLYRPAPIQLSYLGYFTSTGISCINGWIGDTILFKEQEPEDLALPGGAMAMDFDTFPDLKERVNGKFKFGCFNNSRKLTRKTLEIFAEILASCPEAELLLQSPTFQEKKEQERIYKLCETSGIDCVRVKIHGWNDSHIKHLEMYGMVDVGLDPTPYSGATSTIDALGMGVPIVTLQGETSAGCLSASILVHAGLRDWITNNKAAYVTRAVRAYREGPRFIAERQRLRDKIKKSDLGSPKRLARELEDVFEQQLQGLEQEEERC